MGEKFCDEGDDVVFAITAHLEVDPGVSVVQGEVMEVTLGGSRDSTVAPGLLAQ